MTSSSVVKMLSSLRHLPMATKELKANTGQRKMLLNSKSRQSGQTWTDGPQHVCGRNHLPLHHQYLLYRRDQMVLISLDLLHRRLSRSLACLQQQLSKNPIKTSPMHDHQPIYLENQSSQRHLKSTIPPRHHPPSQPLFPPQT